MHHQEQLLIPLLVCPLEDRLTGAQRKLLGLTLGERLLLALAQAGYDRVYLTGGENRPHSSRAGIQVLDAEELDLHEKWSGFLVIAADAVVDGRLLSSPENLPGNLPIAVRTPYQVREILNRPAAFLENLGAGGLVGKRSFAIRVRDEHSRRLAQKALLNSLRKPEDGPVSRHVNRPISLFLTSLLARTGIRPNSFTLVVMIVGASAGLLAALAQPWWVLVLAAVLFQAQSILDGTDGELARLNHRVSHLGQWLDAIGDHLTDYLFCLGLAVGQARIRDWAWLYWLGLAVLLLQTGALYVMFRRLIVMGIGNPLDIPDVITKGPSPGLFGRIVGPLKTIGKRNVYIVLVAILTAFQLPLAGFLLLTAGSITWFAAIVMNEMKLTAIGGGESSGSMLVHEKRREPSG